MFRGLLGLLLLSSGMLLVGCGPDTSHLSKPTATVTWPALKALNSQEVMMGIMMPAQMGDFKTVRKNVADPKIEQLVSAFESEAIPKEFASSARDAAKAKVVTSFKGLIGAVKGNGSDQTLKGNVADLKAALAAVIDPELK